MKNVNRSREKERSLTLPAPRRLAGAGARLAEETAEEEMSDTISEKGVYYLIFVPFNKQSYVQNNAKSRIVFTSNLMMSVCCSSPATKYISEKFFYGI